MYLSIIIVNYNVKYFLEQCLLSIDESTIAFEFETIVIDNNSSDGSIDYLQSNYPKVRFIHNSANEGFAKASNQGIKLSTGKYVLLLNPDTLIGEDVLTKVVDFMDVHPDGGALGLKMINGSGNFLVESKRGEPTPWNFFCKSFGLSKFFPKIKSFGGYNLSHLDKDQIHRVDILAGAFMLIRRDVLNKIGLLDETFFMYGEDIDLSHRITKAGYSNYYIPETIVHYKGESSKVLDKKHLTIFYESMYIYLKKYYSNASIFYIIFLKMGISFRKWMAGIMLNCATKQQKNQEILILDHATLSYAKIIKQMNDINDKHVLVCVHSPRSGVTIGTHFTEHPKRSNPCI